MKLLFIIGLQKSGTSLLNRLLMKQSSITNPFLPEGKHFWGDDPPFTPVAKPCGQLYQSHDGINGHHLSASDYQPQDQQLLNKRIAEAAIKTPVLMNKNPYNSVRIEWLRTMFPDCKIVAIFRNPLANVYSLLKKYALEENQVDWWGVKPKNWQSMISEDLTEQVCNQWRVVNENILEHQHLLDYIMTYADLCANPNIHLRAILNLVDSIPSHLIDVDLTCMDSEYETGGELESKNKLLRQTGSFIIPEQQHSEIEPLMRSQITTINSHTSTLFQSLENIKSHPRIN